MALCLEHTGWEKGDREREREPGKRTGIAHTILKYVVMKYLDIYTIYLWACE